MTDPFGDEQWRTKVLKIKKPAQAGFFITVVILLNIDIESDIERTRQPEVNFGIVCCMVLSIAGISVIRTVIHGVFDIQRV